MMTSKITPKRTISQILIYTLHILSPITLSRPTRRQPKQRLQLHLYKMQYPHHFFMGSCVIQHKMQCPRHFLIGFTRHPSKNAMSISFLYGVQMSPTSTMIFTWKWPSWHCQHISCLHGADMSSMCPSMGTMENHVSCDITLKTWYVISVFLMFLAYQL